MIKQLSLILPGAIALALSIAPILPAFSQSTTTPTAPQVQKHRNRLNLTDDQKAKLKQIRESTRTQIEAVLTDDQKAKLQSLKAQRQAIRQQRQASGQQGQSMKQPGYRGKGTWDALNLTNDQKAKIRTIRQDSRKQMEAVLTPDQLQQFQQMHQQRQQRRQQTPSGNTQPNT